MPQVRKPIKFIVIGATPATVVPGPGIDQDSITWNVLDDDVTHIEIYRSGPGSPEVFEFFQEVDVTGSPGGDPASSFVVVCSDGDNYVFRTYVKGSPGEVIIERGPFSNVVTAGPFTFGSPIVLSSIPKSGFGSPSTYPLTWTATARADRYDIVLSNVGSPKSIQQTITGSPPVTTATVNLPGLYEIQAVSVSDCLRLSSNQQFALPGDNGIWTIEPTNFDGETFPRCAVSGDGKVLAFSDMNDSIGVQLYSAPGSPEIWIFRGKLFTIDTPFSGAFAFGPMDITNDGTTMVVGHEGSIDYLTVYTLDLLGSPVAIPVFRYDVTIGTNSIIGSPSGSPQAGSELGMPSVQISGDGSTIVTGGNDAGIIPEQATVWNRTSLSPLVYTPLKTTNDDFWGFIPWQSAALGIQVQRMAIDQTGDTICMSNSIGTNNCELSIHEWNGTEYQRFNVFDTLHGPHGSPAFGSPADLVLRLNDITISNIPTFGISDDGNTVVYQIMAQNEDFPTNRLGVIRRTGSPILGSWTLQQIIRMPTDLGIALPPGGAGMIADTTMISGDGSRIVVSWGGSPVGNDVVIYFEKTGSPNWVEVDRVDPVTIWSTGGNIKAKQEMAISTDGSRVIRMGDLDRVEIIKKAVT